VTDPTDLATQNATGDYNPDELPPGGPPPARAMKVMTPDQLMAEAAQLQNDGKRIPKASAEQLVDAPLPPPVEHAGPTRATTISAPEPEPPENPVKSDLEPEQQAPQIASEALSHPSGDNPPSADEPAENEPESESPAQTPQKRAWRPHNDKRRPWSEERRARDVPGLTKASAAASVAAAKRRADKELSEIAGEPNSVPDSTAKAYSVVIVSKESPGQAPVRIGSGPMPLPRGMEPWDFLDAIQIAAYGIIYSMPNTDRFCWVAPDQIASVEFSFL